MPVFQSKKFRSSSYHHSFGAFYRKNLNSHPFLLFGLPFIFTIVAGMYISRALSFICPILDHLSSCKTCSKSRRLLSPLLTVLVARRPCFEEVMLTPKFSLGSFILTPATALRYERHDRKVQQMTKEEELGIGKDRRRVDINEEYYRLAAKVSFTSRSLGTLAMLNRVAGSGRLGKQKGQKITRRE